MPSGLKINADYHLEHLGPPLSRDFPWRLMGILLGGTIFLTFAFSAPHVFEGNTQKQVANPVSAGTCLPQTRWIIILTGRHLLLRRSPQLPPSQIPRRSTV